MAEPDLVARISFDPAVMSGRACIRGTRVTVATILGLIADSERPPERAGPAGAQP